MRRNIKFFVTLAAVSAAVFFTNAPSAYAQDSTAIPFTLPDGKTETFFQNQTESIIQYNQLLNNLKPESQNNSARSSSIAWSRSTPVSQGSANNKMYDDNFGGAYIDTNGDLVVMLTNNTYSMRQKVKDYAGSSSLKTQSCSYSYNEIREVIDTINNQWEYLLEQGADLRSMYSSIKNNCVVINVRNLTPRKEHLIRSVIDSKCMVIQNAEEEYEQTSNSSFDMKGGCELYNNSTKKTASLGFCAIRNGKKGYVTASHFAKYPGQQISYNGTVIGTVVKSGFYNNSYADAAFIESNGNAVPTNEILGGYYCTSATAVSDLRYPEGTAIQMYGKKSGLQTGYIYSCDHTYIPYNPEEFTVKDHVLAIYKSAKGDSGGPVFIYSGMFNGKATCSLIGIHTASARVESEPGTSVFAKYENIKKMLGITAITQ